MREQVVRIACEGHSRGTGVVIGPGVVATALHVVADRSGPAPALREAVLRFARFEAGALETVELPARVLDGAWDLARDWALLGFDPRAVPWSLAPAALRELRPEDLEGSRLTWRTYGFPDAFPEDGAPATGHVQTTSAALGGARVLGLFSHEAAAGHGYPVRGLSGAPVFVDGQVVGLLRWALTDQERALYELARSEGGTLYAVPVGELRLPAGISPVAGGGPPPVLRDTGPLPEQPFRYLAPYQLQDAPLFFGRDADLARFFGLLSETPEDRIVLLHGSSGAGKSSFLGAGVAPRCPAFRIERRGAGTLLEAWRTLRGDGPALRVLDQVEEAWTRGAGRPELDLLLAALSEPRPPGRVALAFRKEWLPEVVEALRAHGLRFAAFFLEPLDRGGVIDALGGFERAADLRQHYGLSVENGLPEVIANALAGDRGGGVGPMLQIALTRLWERASARARREGAEVRRLGLDDWELVRADGVGLDDFLERQLAGVAELCPGEARTGLVLEVLHAHRTASETARTLASEELRAELPGAAPERLDAVCRALEGAWLLIGVGPDARRLAHDSLAPAVSRARAVSTAPAQWAQRLLDARLPAWRGGRVGPLLGAEDLAILEAARPAMRSLSADAARLLEASRTAQAPVRRAADAARRGIIAGGLMLAALIGLALAVERADALHLWLARRELDAWWRAGTGAEVPAPELVARVGALPIVRAWSEATEQDARVIAWAEAAWAYGADAAPRPERFGVRGDTAAFITTRPDRVLEQLAYLDGRGAAGADTEIPTGDADLRQVESLWRSARTGVIWQPPVEDLDAVAALLPGLPVEAQRRLLSLPAALDGLWGVWDEEDDDEAADTELERALANVALVKALLEDPDLDAQTIGWLAPGEAQDAIRPSSSTVAQALLRAARLPQVTYSETDLADVTDPCEGFVLAARIALAGDQDAWVPARRLGGDCELSSLVASDGAARARVTAAYLIAATPMSLPGVSISAASGTVGSALNRVRAGVGWVVMNREDAALETALLGEPGARVWNAPIPSAPDEIVEIDSAADLALSLGLEAQTRALEEALDARCEAAGPYVCGSTRRSARRAALALPPLRDADETTTTTCAALLLAGQDPGGCLSDFTRAGPIEVDAALAVALARGGRPEEARMLLDLWRDRLLSGMSCATCAVERVDGRPRMVRDELVPLLGAADAWWSTTSDPELCASSLWLSLGYAGAGQPREAGLAVRRCRNDWIRALGAAEIVARAEGREPWALDGVARWTGLEPEATPSMIGRLLAWSSEATPR